MCGRHVPVSSVVVFYYTPQTYGTEKQFTLSKERMTWRFPENVFSNQMFSYYGIYLAWSESFYPIKSKFKIEAVSNWAQMTWISGHLDSN
ncbi:hypothetical protein KGM_207673 [Danaus plexippus plexippus]|uniref:Uncharacterized protein n=1 Tax=Danaus plexippus plexippus TaxID=278856 RepID=A0A212FDC4_DANPL|nr:hypothetical protein KGM_207673 [Danaus plexippus plexippus]